MVEARDRNADVPTTITTTATTTPTDDAVVITRHYVASDHSSPRPCKRRCLSPSLEHAAEICLASEEAAQAPHSFSAEDLAAEAAQVPHSFSAENPVTEAARVSHPLTAENLSILPHHSAHIHHSPTSNLTSTASTSDSPSVEMTVSDTRTLLKRNRLHIFDDNAEERTRKIIQAGQDIRGRRRSSTMPFEISETLVKTIKKYANKGERTFMFHLWKALLNDTRQVPDRELTLEDDPEMFKWAERAWDKDHVWGKWEADFIPDRCPTLEPTGDAKLDAALSGVPRIATPRPDIGYGFDFEAFSQLHSEMLHQTPGGTITSQQFCTFFAVEAKCGERSIEEAENQCCRTGATMAKSRRDMSRALIEKRAFLQTLRPAVLAMPLPSTDPEAPTSDHMTPAQAPSSDLPVNQPSSASNQPTQDIDTVSFTLAVCPQIAKMCIHFAETWPDGHTEWQMHGLTSYLLERSDGLAELRHDIDNILDWGCTKRKKQITEQAAELAQLNFEIQEAKKAKSTTEAARSKASDTPSKKRKG